LKFNQYNSFDFARDVSRAPLNYKEIVKASRYYPIIFSANERPVPYALLSVKQGENAYVDEKGKWKVPYIPTHIRRYPFIFAKADDKGNYVLGIDKDAPHFSQEQGEPLYTANGEPTDFLNKAADLLKRFQQDMQETEKIFGQLTEKELLTDRKIEIGRGDEKYRVRGFKAVDPEKLKDLDNDTLGAWVKQGIIGLVYAHLHSLENLRGLAGR
jgi:hypothetical protein